MENHGMKTESLAGTVVADRKPFLKRLAVLAGAVTLATAAALACPQTPAQRVDPDSVRFCAQGIGLFTDVVGYHWPSMFAPAPWYDANGYSFKVTYQFPYKQRDQLLLQIFLVPPHAADDPNPLAVPISISVIQIDEIQVGPPVAYADDAGLPPKPTVALLGHWVDNSLQSPFGPIVGRQACITAAFDGEGDNVNFYLLGVSCAGSHATFVPKAMGSIHFDCHRR
jgi:hypothetical protein